MIINGVEIEDTFAEAFDMAATRLTSGGGQLPLFGRDENRKGRAVDRATDRIVDRFGPDAIRRGDSL